MGWFNALLVGLSLSLLPGEAQGQGTGRGKNQVSGRGPINLAHQQRGTWRPLMHLTANLTEVRSIKSVFEFRTLDPEGVVFYGDTRLGEDWFVLCLRDGVPEMQISKADVMLSVAGGPRLNDGQWHQGANMPDMELFEPISENRSMSRKLEACLGLSSAGKFVVLEVDGQRALVVGLESSRTQEELTGQIRLALGGILVDEKKLANPLLAEMDGCVREGNWLNLSLPWETDEQGAPMPCFDAIKPGAFFSGAGLSVLNTSEIPIQSEERGIRIDIWAESSLEMTGAILNIQRDEQSLLTATAFSNTKELKLTVGKFSTTLKLGFKKLSVTLLKASVKVALDDAPFEITANGDTPDYLAYWKEGMILAFGGIPNKGDHYHGTHYLLGCIEKIQIQEEDLDLDGALYKHISVTSHSCPA